MSRRRIFALFVLVFTPGLFAEDFAKDMENERVRLNAFSQHYQQEKKWNSERQKSVKEIAEQRRAKELADEKARQEYVLQKQKQGPALDEGTVAYKQQEQEKKQKEIQMEQSRKEFVAKKSVLHKFQRPISEEKELFVMEDRERVASHRRQWITGGRASLGSGSSAGGDISGGNSFSGGNNDLPPPPPAYNPGTPEIFENDYPPPPPAPGFPQEFDDPILPPPVFDGGEY